MEHLIIIVGILLRIMFTQINSPQAIGLILLIKSPSAEYFIYVVRSHTNFIA